MSDAVVELAGVSVWLPFDGDRARVLIDLDLSIRPGEIVGLVGESGSGKSMTARAIIGALPPGASVDGSVSVAGIDVVKASKSQLRTLRSERMAIVFQDPRSVVNPLWKVGDYLTEGMRVHRGMSRDAARALALDLLEQVGIDSPRRRFDQYPGELSGGMLQRVMIAAALAGDPELVIADEATTGLDVTTQAAIVQRFTELQHERGLAMLFITHDLALASSVCDRICVMYAGRIVETQPGAEIFSRARHPYTNALVAARPDVRARKPEGLTVIPGRPTSGLEAPPGCAFHPRCRFATDRCSVETPRLSAHGSIVGTVACLHVEEIEGGRVISTSA